MKNGEAVSEVYTFKTAGAGAYSFAYVGDPQIGASGNVSSDTSGWENTLNLIDSDENFRNASFLLSAGDQVNKASSEAEYDGYLGHETLKGLPAATVIGNHDSSSNAYAQHFNPANESKEYGVTEAGGDSWFVYNNTLFMVLNSNDKSPAEHKAFMEEAIRAAGEENIKWKVVTFHHSIYTVASHSSDSYITDPTGFKNSMAPIFKELGIDVVLQGHDHVYCRTYIMDGLTPVKESDGYEYGNGEDQAPTAVTDPEGVLYITANSGSGSKTYNIVNADFEFSAVQNQEHVPNVSRVDVSDTEFTVTTYRTTDMSVVDTFTIKHTADENTGDDNTGDNSGSSGGSGGNNTGGSGDGGGSSSGSGNNNTGSSGGTSGTGSSSGTSGSGTSSGSSSDTSDDTPAADYTDVNSSDWFYEAVMDVTKAGLMSGTAEGIFNPHADTTRAMAVTMLYRLEGEPYVSGTSSFRDVSEDAYCADAAAWMEINHIATGKGSGIFAPEEKVTREQLAAFLYRYARFKNVDTDTEEDLSSFSDQPSAWALEAVKWCVGSGIIQGVDEMTLNPEGHATRAQLAAVFSRFARLLQEHR